MNSGIFITIEGSDGSGKSTQAALLRDFLETHGKSVLALREPGGTAIGEEIRQLLKRSDFLPPICPQSELLLFLASRAQVVHQRIRPALAEGKIVLCDRYQDSTFAYQGVARHIPLEIVHQLNDFAIDGCIPDLTFLLDVDPQQGFRRIFQTRGKTQDRLEQEDRDFYESVRRAYLEMARENPTRFCLLDASKSIETLQMIIHQQLKKRFPGQF